MYSIKNSNLTRCQCCCSLSCADTSLYSPPVPLSFPLPGGSLGPDKEFYIDFFIPGEPLIDLDMIPTFRLIDSDSEVVFEIVFFFENNTSILTNRFWVIKPA